MMVSPQLHFQEIFKKLNWSNKGIKVGSEYQSDLQFTDDIVLFSITIGRLKTVIKELDRESLQVGLKMNKKKKVMFNNYGHTEQEEALYRGNYYVYLGQLKQTNWEINDIKKREGHLSDGVMQRGFCNGNIISGH